MKNVVVYQKLIGVSADGQEQEIEIKIGLPYQIPHEDSLEEWACPVSLSPLYKRLHDAHGADPLQALCLAISLVLDLLKAYIEKGGKLPDFVFEAYAFGIAFKNPDTINLWDGSHKFSE
jgi:hypothetical protein